MSLRQKLLLLLSLMVAVVVAAVAWTVLIRVRQVFEQRDQEETALFVSQFQREFQQRSAEVAAAVDRILDVPLPTIETVGGGGARCMLAEVPEVRA